MNAHKYRRSLLMLCLAAGLVPAVVRGAEAITGQPAFGSLHGITLAPGGLPLPEVSVVLRSVAGSTDRRVASDSKGVFTADDLQPGSYQITAFKEGFTTPSPTTIEIAQNQVSKTDVALAAAVTQPGAGKLDVAPLCTMPEQVVVVGQFLVGRCR